jgi:hypothetical protein
MVKPGQQAGSEDDNDRKHICRYGRPGFNSTTDQPQGKKYHLAHQQEQKD